MRHFHLILFSLAFSAAASASLEDAQKAYVSGDWKTAAENFEQACPNLELSKRSECALWGILARSQMGNSKDFSVAKKRLDSLIATTPDSLPVSADLYMTRAQFELYLKRADLSYKSLKTAFARSNKKQLSVIHQVCQSLYKATPTDSVHSLCEAIERARTGTDSTATAGSSSATSSSSSSSSAEMPVATSSSAAEEQIPAVPQWTLQLGAFSIESNAEMLSNSLKAKKIDAKISPVETDEKKLYRVLTGSFSSKEEALDYGKRVLLPLELEFQPTKNQ